MARGRVLPRAPRYVRDGSPREGKGGHVRCARATRAKSEGFGPLAGEWQRVRTPRSSQSELVPAWRVKQWAGSSKAEFSAPLKAPGQAAGAAGGNPALRGLCRARDLPHGGESCFPSATLCLKPEQPASSAGLKSTGRWQGSEQSGTWLWG